jgi:hypothetical protein
MLRYYFHVRDGRTSIDTEGTEFASLEDARVDAVRLAGAMLTDHAPIFWKEHDWELQVTDAANLTVFTLSVTGSMAMLPHSPSSSA